MLMFLNRVDISDAMLMFLLFFLTVFRASGKILGRARCLFGSCVLNTINLGDSGHAGACVAENIDLLGTKAR
jgi:hypothetical protein